MPELIPPVRRALILSGGGARGAYQVGVWKRLQEIGWQPDMVCGSSIGALNGSLIGSGWDADRMEEFWESLHSRRVFTVSVWRRLKYRMNKLLGRQPDWPALMDNEPMRQMLSEMIDVQRLRQNQPKVVVTATNIRKAKLEYFSGEELSVDHILASCSIPAIFPWREINGEFYWDGGILANTPIFPALQAGAREILAVLLAPLTGAPIELPKSTREAFSWTFDMMTIASARSLTQTLAHRLNMDLRDNENAFAQQQFLDWGDVRIGVVAPRVASSMDSVLDLSLQNVKVRIATGYNDAREQITGFLDQPRDS